MILSVRPLPLFDRLTRWVWSRQTWTLELYLAVQSTVWGAWLLMPWDSFGVIPDAYTILGLVPEWMWGAAFTAHGLAHLTVLHRRDPHQCRRAALALAMLWSAVVVSLLLTIPLSTATPIYGSSVLGAVFVYVSLDWRYPRRA